MSQKEDVDFAFKNPKPLSAHPQSSASYKDEVKDGFTLK